MNVIVDTREKHPWTFSSYKKIQPLIGKLDTGDYTLEGFEDSLCIERKRNTSELSVNVGLKRDRFEREFERMYQFDRAVLICEFPLSHFDVFPKESGIPKRYWKRIRTTGKFIKRSIFELCDEYEVELYFCKDKYEAEKKAVEIMIECQNTQ